MLNPRAEGPAERRPGREAGRIGYVKDRALKARHSTCTNAPIFSHLLTGVALRGGAADYGFVGETAGSPATVGSFLGTDIDFRIRAMKAETRAREALP